jgi:hypothetical protein
MPCACLVYNNMDRARIRAHVHCILIFTLAMLAYTNNTLACTHACSTFHLVLRELGSRVMSCICINIRANSNSKHHMAGSHQHTWQVHTSIHGRFTPAYMAGSHQHTWQVHTSIYGRFTPAYMAGSHQHTWQVHTSIYGRSYMAGSHQHTWQVHTSRLHVLGSHWDAQHTSLISVRP